jgi:hypothetical protein
MGHKEITMQHNDLRVVQIVLEDGSEILIWNVGYEDGSVGVRIEDKVGSSESSAGEVHKISLSSKLKSIKIMDDQEMSFTHTGK